MAQMNAGELGLQSLLQHSPNVSFAFFMTQQAKQGSSLVSIFLPDNDALFLLFKFTSLFQALHLMSEHPG